MLKSHARGCFHNFRQQQKGWAHLGADASAKAACCIEEQSAGLEFYKENAAQALSATAAHLQVCSVLLEELLSVLTRLDSSERSQAGQLSLDCGPITVRLDVTLTEHDLQPDIVSSGTCQLSVSAFMLAVHSCWQCIHVGNTDMKANMTMTTMMATSLDGNANVRGY